LTWSHANLFAAIATAVIATLYEIAELSAKLSYKNPKTTLATKNEDPHKAHLMFG